MADAARILMTEGDAPIAPSTGQNALYTKTDHLFYSKGSDGVERPLKGDTGEGLNDLNALTTAENDVLVGAPTPFGSWVKKTVAEFKTILGLGSAAYTASTAYDASGAAAGVIAASISDGDVTHAPDGNSVFDALALKAPLNSPSFTTPTSDMIKFGTTPTVGDFVEGKLYYDNLWKTLSLEAGWDITLQIGQEEWRRVYNTGAAILNGQPVYPTGVYSGALPHVTTVGLAGSATAAESFVLGIATQDIDTNTYGFITIRGNVNGLKTDHAGWTVGDSLYLSETAGLLTNIKPVAPYYEVRVGRVIDVHATLGIINVRIRFR
jgi:hypothetical protein